MGWTGLSKEVVSGFTPARDRVHSSVVERNFRIVEAKGSTPFVSNFFLFLKSPITTSLSPALPTPGGSWRIVQNVDLVHVSFSDRSVTFNGRIAVFLMT